MTKPFEIPKMLVWNAFQRVKANGGSAGVDDQSIEAFEMNISDNLYKLWNCMAPGSYFPPPVKAVPIPKKSGGTRMLGVPKYHANCTWFQFALGKCRDYPSVSPVEGAAFWGS